MEAIYVDHKLHHATYRKGMFCESGKSKKKFANLSVCLEHNIFLASPLILILLCINQVTFALVLTLFSIFHFMLFNQLHAGLHLSHRLRFLPGWYRKLCLYGHYLHHQRPDKFFCVAMPGADYLFGTTCKMTQADREGWEKLKSVAHIDRKKDQQSIDNANFCQIPAFFRYLRDSSTDGYVPEPISKRRYELGQIACHIFKITQLGKITVNGKIPETQCIIASNHPSWLDIFILATVAGRPMHLMAAESVLRFSPIISLFCTLLLGAYPAATKKAVESSVEILKSGRSIMICPEGWATMTNEMLLFKTGIARIAKESGVPVVPMYIYYSKLPPKEILKLHFFVQCILTWLFFSFRGPVTVNIGEPVIDLPDDIQEATKKIRNMVLECKYQ